MKKQHPAPWMDLPISLEIYQQLICAATQNGCQLEDWEIGAMAIREWLVRHDPDQLKLPALQGFQWKALFLPHGTLLRSVFNGKNYHCRVEEDQILYAGAAISPSAFVNAIGGVRRNAWQTLWILFPNSETWKLAAALRRNSGSQNPHKARARNNEAVRIAAGGFSNPAPERRGKKAN